MRGGEEGRVKVTRPQRWFQCTRKALSFKKASVTDSEDIQSPMLRLVSPGERR